MNKFEFDPSKPIAATGICTIQAQAQEEGKPRKLPTVEIQAYNGGKMAVDWWGDIVIDLSGLTASQKTPMLLSHNSYSLEAVLGQTDTLTNDGKTLGMSGRIMAETETTAKVLTLAKNGYQFQASVGVRPTKYRLVKEGEVADANGQTFSGPFYLIEAGKLAEISIVPLGADDSTSAKIAASQNQNQNRSNQMPDKNDPAATAETIRAAAIAEENRINKIREITKDYPTVTATAIKEGYSVERAELETVKAANVKLTADIEAAKSKIEGKNEADDIKAKRPEGSNIPPMKKEVKADSDTLTAAAAMAAGMKSPDKVFSAETCEIAASMKIRSMTDLIRAALALSGKHLDCSRHDTADFIRAAFSTATISSVLSNVANKFIMQGYGAVEQAWREVSYARSVVDFKANTGVRLVMSSLLKALAPTGEIQHGSLSDETRSIQADTKALMLSISRKDIINDDLGVLSEGPQRLGFAAGRTFNVDFWKAFTDAIAANFKVADGKVNQTTGALNLAGLAKLEALFLGLTDSDGNPMGASPSRLLVSPANGAIARELFTSTGTIGGTEKSGGQNIFAGMYKPVVTSYLTGVPWYLVSDPMAMPLMEAAFLNGNQTPTVETADADFNMLGIQMRCYFDYGVSFGDWRAAVRSTGA